MCKVPFIQWLVAIVLFAVAWVRTEFSLDRIASPLFEEEAPLSQEVLRVLSQPYHFLDRGRQAFVFESQDGAFVLKFFDRKYMEVPWYARWWHAGKEKKKRALRTLFYLQSYRLAEKFLKEETALLCVHLGMSNDLPIIRITDRANRSFWIDLNTTPFILQKKGTSLYPFWTQVYNQEGKEGLLRELDAFLDFISHRLSLGLSDFDHDVRRNFGVVQGSIVHLDPGRLMPGNFTNRQVLDNEWRRATYSLVKWLKRTHPDVVAEFEEHLQKRKG